MSNASQSDLEVFSDLGYASDGDPSSDPDPDFRSSWIEPPNALHSRTPSWAGLSFSSTFSQRLEEGPREEVFSREFLPFSIGIAQCTTDGMSARKFEERKAIGHNRTRVRSNPRTYGGAVDKAEWRVLIRSTAAEGEGKGEERERERKRKRKRESLCGMAPHEPLEWCWAMDKETQMQKAALKGGENATQNGGTAEALYSNLLLTVLRVGSYITVCSYLHRLDYLFMTTKRGMMTAARMRCPVALVLSGERVSDVSAKVEFGLSRAKPSRPHAYRYSSTTQITPAPSPIFLPVIVGRSRLAK